MRNVATHRDAHEAFNRRDWDGAVRDFAPAVEYIDHPRGTTAKGPGQFVDYLRGGVLQLRGRQRPLQRDRRRQHRPVRRHRHERRAARADAPHRPQPPTGRSLNMPMCEALTYDADGRVIRGELYYDQVTMLVQLGHMPPPEG